MRLFKSKIKCASILCTPLFLFDFRNVFNKAQGFSSFMGASKKNYKK